MNTAVNKYHVRWMIRRDLQEILDTEQRCFEYPWLEEDFLSCLRQRNCIGMVAEYGEKVIGHMIYTLHTPKLHIENFAVAPMWWRLGVGREMVDKLISKLSQHRRKKITLLVRETNLIAQLFFHAQGFRAIGVKRNHWQDTNEDAYKMIYRLGGNAHESE